MASKWEKVLPSLTPLPPEDDKLQTEINGIKQEITDAETHTPESLAKTYIRTRMGEIEDPQLVNSTFAEFADQVMTLFGKEGLELLLKKVNKRLMAISQLLDESLDRDEPGWGQYGAGPTTVKLSSGATVSVQYKPACKVKDKEQFRRWCIDNGLEQSLQLWPTTMQSISSQKLLEGEPLPDGVVAHSTYTIVYRGQNLGVGDD